jgi:hypothetical protein
MHKDVVRYLPVRNSFSEAVPDFNPTVSGSPGATKDDADEEDDKFYVDAGKVVDDELFVYAYDCKCYILP